MRVSDIYEELKEATGTGDEAVNFRALTRAIELLANSGLFDPLLGTIDFLVSGGYLISLPRDVKTPIRLNIENNPAVARSRLYEFSPNSAGTVDGEEIGWQWHERGYSPIQDELKLPSKLSYLVSSAEDEGKTAKIIGLDPSGNERTETLAGLTGSPVQSEFVYSEVRNVVREATAREAYLVADSGAVARYQAEDEEPFFRVIKVSKTGVAVRMLYRKHVFKITSQEDIIPLHSAMAVIRAVDAVRLMQRRKYEDAAVVLKEAEGMISKEQASRDEGETLSGTMELQSAINTNINTNGVLIVADIYDSAAEIIGPVHRAKLFDKITDAINALANKSQWDSMIGNVDILRVQDCTTTTTRGRDGYFVLPREVGSVLALLTSKQPGIPRNRWFEYHLNGTGGTSYASCGTWDEAGDVAIINRIPRDEDGDPIAMKMIAVADNALDAGETFTIYGTEELEDGRIVEIWRDGALGWTGATLAAIAAPVAGSPSIVSVERIKREATVGFVTLMSVTDALAEDVRFGYWYPDEIEPRYRMIKVAGCGTQRLRMRYRKRNKKVASLYDVINLQSKLALESMLRAIAIMPTDANAAQVHEAIAVKYLREEQLATNPISAGGLQFAPGTAPGFHGNIQ